MRKAYLILENGRTFEGVRFGADAEAEGEAVFTTGMTGYLRTLTDPACAGQIVVQTFPLIGNYGVIPAEFASPSPRLAAYVVREICEKPSNFRSEGNLDAYLKACGVPGLCGVDTRSLTRLLRAEGVMRVKLSDTPAAAFDSAEPVYGYGGSAITAPAVSTRTPPDARHRVALWDFGATASISQALFSRGCEVVTFPAASSAWAVLAAKPDGILLSSGPGDPAAGAGFVAEIGVVARAGIPMLGIGLGHQLLALSQGGRTYKMKVGHRGVNQPSRHVKTGRIYITDQNHGYAVSLSDLSPNMEATYINANDGSCEGLRYRDLPAFSVQFQPEACAGPLGSGHLFDEFVGMLET